MSNHSIDIVNNSLCYYYESDNGWLSFCFNRVIYFWIVSSLRLSPSLIVLNSSFILGLVALSIACRHDTYTDIVPKENKDMRWGDTSLSCNTTCISVSGIRHSAIVGASLPPLRIRLPRAPAALALVFSSLSFSASRSTSTLSIND